MFLTFWPLQPYVMVCSYKKKRVKCRILNTYSKITTKMTEQGHKDLWRIKTVFIVEQIIIMIMNDEIKLSVGFNMNQKELAI